METLKIQDMFFMACRWNKQLRISEEQSKARSRHVHNYAIYAWLNSTKANIFPSYIGLVTQGNALNITHVATVGDKRSWDTSTTWHFSIFNLVLFHLHLNSLILSAPNSMFRRSCGLCSLRKRKIGSHLVLVYWQGKLTLGIKEMKSEGK